MHFRLFFVLSFLFLFVAHTSFGKSCDKGKKLLILPIKFSKGKKVPPEDPRAIITILLKDYFSLIKGVSPTLSPTTPAENILSGEIVPNGKQFKLISHIDSAQHQEIFRFEGEFEFPGTLNLLLLKYVKEVSPSLGKKISDKDVLPFLNSSSSAMAYQKYAEGRIALMKKSWKEAATTFEEAIKNDYNYVPAYLGLSEALEQQFSPRAKVELEKAKLLNPVVTKHWEKIKDCP